MAAVSELVLSRLCPTLYTVLEDGLKRHLHSVFGKVKNSVWKVVETSAEPGTDCVYFTYQLLVAADQL